MCRLCLIVFVLAAGLVLVAAATASAAPGPTVTSVSPLRVKAGGTLTLKGRRFSSRRLKNTVIFRSPAGRSLFVKPRRAGTRRLVLTVPRSIERFLTRDAGGKLMPTRFRLRVLARRFGRTTSRGLSPLVYPRVAGSTGGPGGDGDGDCDNDGIKNLADSDDDNDVLSDLREAALGTDPCKRDTDGDGAEDAHEVESALDLNSRAVPYAGKRPYPNALDPSDATTDYDGDGLTLLEESQLWVRYGAQVLPLSYSDGKQRSAPIAAPSAPPLAAYTMDIDGDGSLSDDERDADGDGLGNWDEAHGRMTEGWWVAVYDGTNNPAKETKYPLAFLSTSFLDPDTDGDGLPDGADDQDHDGLSNAFELRRPLDWATTYVSYLHPGTNAWARVQPFNPCKPVGSDLCHKYPSFGYYPVGEDWDSPPAPGSPPVTPAG